MHFLSLQPIEFQLIDFFLPTHSQPAVPMMIAFMMQAWVSVKRIDKFLNAEEIDSDNVSNNPSVNALEISGDGTFTWGGETTTLKNINLKVKKGNLTAIVGSVGCGKTSLISALLGEMEKLKGQVNTDGSVAYVPQQGEFQAKSRFRF